MGSAQAGYFDRLSINKLKFWVERVTKHLHEKEHTAVLFFCALGRRKHDFLVRKSAESGAGKFTFDEK